MEVSGESFLREQPSTRTSVQIFTLFGQDPRDAAPVCDAVYTVAIMRIIFTNRRELSRSLVSYKPQLFSASIYLFPERAQQV